MKSPNKRITNTKSFIEKSINKFGEGAFDYSSVIYKKWNEKIVLKCNKCNSIVEISPNKHIYSKYGCSVCGCAKKGTSIRLSFEELMSRFNKQHPNKVSVNEKDYRGIDSPMKMICNSCEREFVQSPYTYLKTAGYCSTCNWGTTPKKFVENAIAIHGNKYSYDRALYRGSKKKVNIKCNTCKYVFDATPDAHINRGSGCPRCNQKGTYNEKNFANNPNIKKLPAFLYIVKFKTDSELFIKIGITTNSRGFNGRVASNMTAKYDIDILDEIKMPLYEAWKLEQKLLIQYRNMSYKPKYKFQGHTECLHFDSYELITEAMHLNESVQ